MAAALALSGCSDSSPYGKLYPVSGVVTIDGQPAPRGTVRFKPDAAKGNTSTHEPFGMVGPDGRYTLTVGGEEGAPLGWYLVTVHSNEPIDSTRPNAIPPSLIARKYHSPSTSGLAVEVVASPAPGAYDLKTTAK